MAVDDDGVELAHQILQQLASALLAKMFEHADHPFSVAGVHGDAARPLLLLQKLLVGLGQVLLFHQRGVVGGRIIGGVDPIPSPIGIARFRPQVFGFRRIELLGHLWRQAAHHRGGHDVPGGLPRPGLGHDARGERRLRAPDEIDLHPRHLLKQLQQRQGLLLIGGGINGQLPLGLRRRQNLGHDPGGQGPLLGAQGRGGGADQERGAQKYPQSDHRCSPRCGLVAAARDVGAPGRLRQTGCSGAAPKLELPCAVARAGRPRRQIQPRRWSFLVPHHQRHRL